jgi:prophage antirepressor-like protein
MNTDTMAVHPESLALNATTAFHLRTYPVRMVAWADRRWFIAADVARAVGNVSLLSIRQYVPQKHQRELALRLPEGELRMLVLSEQGLRPVLARQRRKAQAAEFLEMVAMLPAHVACSTEMPCDTASSENEI